MHDDITELIEAQLWFFRDEPLDQESIDRLKFHLDTGDYFPMLATMLGFVQESVQDCSCNASDKLMPIETNALKDLRSGLMYLQKNYRIVPISEEKSEKK